MVGTKIKPLKTFNIRLRGDRWTVYLYSNYKFTSVYPDTLAITCYKHHVHERDINFSVAGATMSTIVHELIHAYLSYHDFSKKSYGAIEEHICDILGRHHPQLYKLATHIYKELNDR